MITILNRQLIDVSFLPDLGAFTGHVSLTYAFADDPDWQMTIRLPVSQQIDPRTRFTRIENALVATAVQNLMKRLENIGSTPENIFSDDGMDIAA